MTSLALLPLAVTLCAAPFEGEIVFDVKADAESSEGRVVRSKSGDLRVDLSLLGGGQGAGVPMTFIVPASNDDILVHAVHPVKAFDRVDMKPASDAKKRWQVVQLSARKILGRTTVGWKLTDNQSGDVVDVWLDETLGDGTGMARVQETMKPSHRGAWLALRAAGARGFPLAMVWRRKLGGRVEVMTKRVQPMEVPARAFDLPSSYKRSPVGLKAFTGMGTR